MGLLLRGAQVACPLIGVSVRSLCVRCDPVILPCNERSRVVIVAFKVFTRPSNERTLVNWDEGIVI